ncbi:MAG: peptidoglycan-binding domain-containing protein [Bauldia litoralis]
MQKLLASKGHYDGPIDGKIGSGSRGAIRDYQLKVGLVPDGVDSVKVLKHLEASR